MIKEYKIDDLNSFYYPHLDFPVEISYMSIDKNEKYNFNDKIVPILNENFLNKTMKYDLLSDFEVKEVPLSNDKDENHILYLLLDLNKKKISFPMKFISYRGTLTKISAIPYENMENLTFSLIKLNGKIFFWWYSSDNQTKTLDHLKCIHSGFRFETLITTLPKDHINDGPLNNCKFLSAVHTKLYSTEFSHDLFYAGEIDCIREKDNNYVEIKSRIKKPNDFALRRFCFLKWWLQSYLIGIDTVIVGFRNKDFIVEDIEEYNIRFFYNSARDFKNGKDLWNPDVCFSFLGNFLSKVENFMDNFGDSDICVFNFNVGSKKITFTKTTQLESPQYDFLPQWFRTQWKE